MRHGMKKAKADSSLRFGMTTRGVARCKIQKGKMPLEEGRRYRKRDSSLRFGMTTWVDAARLRRNDKCGRGARR
jgi:hypothetical protein